MSVSLVNLTDLLRRRSAQAILSLWSPASTTLRAELERRLEAWPGEAEALLSSPVFEHRFEYERDPRTMAELPEELVCPALIEAMDRTWPKLEEQRFARSWRPYVHQVQAWKALRQEPARSVVVATGTGSGKTECFLVPILDHLARTPKRRHQGVQALMLYPLNALIESQRERFSAWTRHFGGAIRYCLYNGDTPNGAQPSRIYKDEPERVHDRATLREDPPPLLVTNSTMLEYMLVRPEDNPILMKSQGSLRYIVIDEAHTYLGSQAAELALLLRRVLSAFGVSPKHVRFVATSATIGGPDAKAALRRFLANISGQSEAQVDVIDGRHEIPPLPEVPAREIGLDALRAMSDEERYAALAASPVARKLRSAVVSKPSTLAELAKATLGSTDLSAQRQTLELVDLAHRSRSEMGSFFPVRAHFQVRTLPGLWACGDPACTHHGDLAPPWPFGAVYLQPRASCQCGAPVWPVATCGRCGAEYLEGLFDAGKQTFTPPALNPLALLDEPSVETGAEDEEQGEDELAAEDTGRTTKAWMRPDEQGGYQFDIRAQRMEQGSLRVSLVEFPTVGDDPTTCVCCGNPQRNGRPPFRAARIGTPFMLGVVLPVVLGELPALSPASEMGLPFGGRRLITFTDSRQGSARFAAIQQGEVERAYVRSLLYQTAWAQSGGSQAERDALMAEIAELQNDLSEAPERFRKRFEADLRKKEAELAAISESGIPLRKLARLVGQDAQTTWLYNERARHATFDLREGDLPELLLLRELARRPMRRTSLEAMGLVGLRYPGLADATAPGRWRRLGGTDTTWRDYLKLCVDYFIRQNLALDLPKAWREWLGIPMRTHLLAEPGRERTPEVLPWPALHRTHRPHRLAAILLSAFQLDREDHHEEVNELLELAWLEIRKTLLAPRDQGFYLDLLEKAELVPRLDVHICPATRAAVDTILCGRSPFQPLLDPNHPLAVATATCARVELPQPPLMLGGAAPNIEDWLRSDPKVQKARELGLWSEFHDRVVAFQRLYFLREHSAQIAGDKLRKYTESFKEGRVNVLSCSTTMEMGVDIGSLPAVVMNNVPPAAANYRQRAGRAGRRRESIALAVTVARALPHDQTAFADPTWAFTRAMHVTSVSLDRVRIVRRHVNARVLNAFLVSRAQALKLTCGAFFFNEGALYPSFLEWLDGRGRDDKSLLLSLGHLVKRTALDGWPVNELLEEVKTGLMEVFQRLNEERGALIEHRGRFPEETAGWRSLGFQLARLDGEYLLSWLASAQFLPGYGMPTDLVPFVNLTLADLKAEKRRKELAQSGETKEARRGRSRDYPTYDAALALRAYAPGSAVVVDGLSYRSAGVTLNWKLPPDAARDEVQSIKEARSCPDCGHVEITHRMEVACPQCGSTSGRSIRFLAPAGFAVDLYEDPTTDVATRTWIPVESPLISAGDAPWVALGEVVSMRHSADGVIFHQSRGEHRHGYALCLRCGRAAAEHEPGGAGDVPKALADHRRLQGGKSEVPGAEANVCDGKPGTFAIQRGLTFGAHQATDVFELRLYDPVTGQSPNETMATTIAVALRDALADRLGVESDEIGFGLGTWRRSGDRRYTICLFDAAVGGAGFVAELPGCLPEMLHEVRRRLSACSCQRACERCLLDSDTQHHLQHLDRHLALHFLREELLASLSVPSKHAGAQWEFQPPGAGLLRELRERGARNELCKPVVRLWAGASADLDLQRWRANPLLTDLRRAGVAVELVFAPGTLRALDEMDARLLSALCEPVGANSQWRVAEG
jgi:DEAD/DEAH box helicase domain-containing protein